MTKLEEHQKKKKKKIQIITSVKHSLKCCYIEDKNKKNIRLQSKEIPDHSKRRVNAASHGERADVDLQTNP